jgi:deazaflavin-dependent oxidoreductase (nitroreductase family)
VDEAVQKALTITRDSTVAERRIDITTIGARTGRPRRLETWLYRAGGRLYLTGRPGRRDWYANLLANPRFTVHLKHRVVADLPATAEPITDARLRRRVFAEIIANLDGPHMPVRENPPAVDDWLAGSPLVEIRLLFPVLTECEEKASVAIASDQPGVSAPRPARKASSAGGPAATGCRPRSPSTA